MKTLLVLVLVAALGTSLAARAQAPAIEGVTVRPACALGASYPPNSNFDALPDSKTRRIGESPGTRAWVEKAVQSGGGALMTDPPEMTLALRISVKLQSKRINEGSRCLGAFKSVRFLHVSARGLDDYEVKFANGALEYAIAPLNARGEAAVLWLRGYSPQPATMQFDAFLTSLEGGRPNYADLAADAASRLQAQWPALQKSLKDWGRLKALHFARQEEDGSYVYQATYENRQVLWSVLPQDADGKFAAVTYNEKAG
jgi:hypothetical protein